MDVIRSVSFPPPECSIRNDVSAGGHPSSHDVQGYSEGQTLCIVVLQEGVRIQQVQA